MTKLNFWIKNSDTDTHKSVDLGFVLVFLLLTIISFTTSAQTTNPRINSYNPYSWFQYIGNHKFSDRWGLHSEIQIRRTISLDDWQQLLLRTAADYYVNDQVRISVGYAFINTFPHGDYPAKNSFPEHRAWQNLLLTHIMGNIHMQHRFRTEQRFIGDATTGEFKNTRYENRFRYMFRVVLPFKRKALEANDFYLAFQNEIFINAGKEVQYNIFDQNRLYGAVGFHMGKPGKIELGFMHQIVQQKNIRQPMNQLVMENNNTIVLAYFHSLHFFE